MLRQEHNAGSKKRNEKQRAVGTLSVSHLPERGTCIDLATDV
jgi:hypothetical protein